MSAQEWSEWLDDLEKARVEELAISSKIRNGQGASVGSSVQGLKKRVAKLEKHFSDLKMETSAFTVTEDELARREKILDELKKALNQVLQDFNNRGRFTSEAAKGNVDLLSMQTQIIQDQDLQLDDISRGVSTLHKYSIAVKDETDLHIRLLNDIDDDVNEATVGLEAEGRRAAKVAEKSQLWRLYIAIIILFVILIFLLIVGSN